MNTSQDRTPNAAVTAPAAPTRTPMFSRAVAGGIAGLIAAIAVLAAAILYSWLATPEEAWLPMKNVAATWLGVDALIGGGWTVVLGVASHFVNSIGWGIVFALLMDRRRNVGVTLLAGFVWGMVVWLVMTWVALPLIDSTMAARVAVQPVWWWWMLHVIFGVVLGAALLAIGGVASARGRGGAERVR